jgi:DNA polymerase-3 subunit epsilon
MREVCCFTAGYPLVAHNAAFDRAFWQAEAARAGCVPDAAHAFACTVLLSRRLYPEAPNYRLGTLAQWHLLPNAGRAHRSLADAETTAHLLVQMQRDLQQRYADALANADVTHALLVALQRAKKAALQRCIERYRAGAQATLH